MIYLTYKTKNKTKQLDLFDSIYNDTPEIQKNQLLDYPTYSTIKTHKICTTEFNKTQENNLIKYLKKFLETKQHIISDVLENTENYYTTFKIPKHSGGFRTIDAPNAILKTLLREVKDILQDYCSVHPHNAAYAYIPKRCARHAIEKHQYNKSKHFLHLDLKDFFQSCTETFIHQQLKQVYPLNTLYNNPEHKEIIEKIIKLSLYKGHLPQGTPLSPFLTNIIMVPIDYQFQNLCKQRNKQHFVYTRYADDIDISSKYDFNHKDLLKELEEILNEQTPLKINTNKIHYGTTAGRNWHLGLLLNNENKISIGNKKKKEIKNILLNFCTHRDLWTKEDMQQFHGQLAYFHSIEPEYHDYLIEKYSEKYNQGIDILSVLRNNI